MSPAAPFESYCTSVVRPLAQTTRVERERLIAAAHYNLFRLASDTVTFDLLTDSGTGAISNQQLAALIMGDESYAGSTSFEQMKSVITELTGFPFVIPTHQGRGAENVLHSALVHAGDVVPGNTHFDTTKGHIEFRKAHAIDCTIEAGKNPTSDHPFKGNIDLARLEEVLQAHPRERIPFVLITVTCNSSGGQPVSLENIQAVKTLCHRYGVKVFLDMARFAENAYFIKTREAAYRDWTIRAICREMFRDTDGATMSAKKDAITAMGGFLALHDEDLYRHCGTFSILFEGFLTYGGMTGGTMAAVAAGLQEATDFAYLQSRVEQVGRFGAWLQQAGVPIVLPVGGHAVYLDASRFLPHLQPTAYPAQALAVAAYVAGGVRGVEIGTVLADRDPETRAERHPPIELYRLAIPRRTYSDNHLRFVADTFAALLQQRDTIPGLEIIWEAPIMRHFTCQFRIQG
ncbi:MAG: tryptophanase [Deltaproteobacteria bacterium]|nr:tryptophanase [Deltaproteobacteria bacterium]